MSDLELLKRYLQNEIDSGNHKMFIFDKDYNSIEFKIGNALSEIELLEKRNKKLQEEKDHYKHLYSEVKKQKDDGIDWIKNNYCYVGKKMTLKPFIDLKDLLRMLGEIE